MAFRRVEVSPAKDSGRDASRFATVDGLWSDALRRGLRAPGFRLVRDGQTLTAPPVTRSAGIGNRTITDLVQPNRVLELYQAGATMVLQGLQFTDPHLARIANNIALALDHPVQVNAYLTPPGTKGLELHFDFHDVFVLQLDGRKRWRIWEPLERTRDPVRGGPTVRRPSFDELGPPALDIELRAGDCVYLPRGFPHAAESLDESSAHLTIGLLAITWQRALQHAVGALAGTSATSGSMPAGSLVGGGPSAATAPIVAGIETALDPHVLRRWMANEVWRRQPATRLRPLCPPDVDDATALCWTPGPLIWLTAHGDWARLGLGDRELVLPAETLDFLRDLVARDGPLSVTTGPAVLDTASRRIVVRRLVAEGALTRA